MTEIDDPIKDFYEKTLLRLTNGKTLTGRGKKLPRSSGYLGSINAVSYTHLTLPTIYSV